MLGRAETSRAEKRGPTHHRTKTARLRTAAPRTPGYGSPATEIQNDGASRCDGNRTCFDWRRTAVLPNDAMQLTGASHPRVPVTEFEPLAGACAFAHRRPQLIAVFCGPETGHA
jgi:hypothetical protein